MKVVVTQPRYLPALYYLKRIYNADAVVLLDNIQRAPREFENRNRLMLGGVPKWLTIPVKGGSQALMQDCKVQDGWTHNHMNRIKESYKGHDHYSDDVMYYYYSTLDDFVDYDYVLRHALNAAVGLFNINTPIYPASHITSPQYLKGRELIKWYLQHFGATEYICGSNGAEYGITNEYLKDIDCEVFVHATEPVIPAVQNPLLGFLDSVFTYGREAVEDCIKNPNLKRHE